jgi:hypothetical protein
MDMHPRRLVPVVAAAGCLAGCGGAVAHQPAAPAPPAPTISLTIRVWPDAAVPGLYTFRLVQCGGPSPVTRSSARICPALRALSVAGLVDRTPLGIMCSMLYGGPGLVRVDGVFNHTPVHAVYRRTDGCQVARWQRLVGLGLVPARTGAAPSSGAAAP